MRDDIIKGVLIDLSGTLHIDKKAIPGAVEAIRKLRKSGLPFRFATNTTKESPQQLRRKLDLLGFEVQDKEIFTSLSACRDLVVSKNLRPMLLMEDAALETFEGIDCTSPNAVVIGLAPSKFDYNTMNSAFRLIMDTDAPLIAVHKARYFADKDEKLSLGPGGFVQALEYATGKTATVVGKPTKSFFELAIAELGMTSMPQTVAIIGDDILADLGGGAIEMGFYRYLVKTGKYKEGDEQHLASFEETDDGKSEVFDSIVEAIDHVLH
ncbi:haloacid dehalogenase-like hydrolase domain-containing 2 [Umbelopsis sp. PMI_123]|nr:haloacid dehalogenase-like hydrolase domain-containing 2 [Umbelopsis sp. PMI_123]